MWASFLEKHFEPKGKNEIFNDGKKYSAALYLKKFLTEEVQKFLKEEGGGKTEIEVVDINFAFNNHTVINLLKDRGAAIIACEFDIVKKLEKEILDLVQNDHANLTRPVTAFITFNKDEGTNKILDASKLFKSSKDR